MFSRRSNVRRPSAPPSAKPSFDFSFTGFLYVAMMLFMVIAALNAQANLLFAVFGLMAGVLLVSTYISRAVVRKLELRRLLPEYMVVGCPATIQYEFENRKRFWPSLSVTCSEITGIDAFTKQPQAYLLHAAAGTRAAIPTQVVPTRRGLLCLDHYQLLTSFPFGFIRRAANRNLKDAILVYPPLAEVDKKLLALCLSAERSGASMRPRRGGTDEFYGVKEYRQGENPRWIYWRRSARTGVLVSKEMTQVAPPRLLVLVDTHLPEPSLAAQAAVERVIAMAASLVSQGLDDGLAVGLYAWSGDWTMVSASRGKRHRRELLSVLARLPQNTAGRVQDLVDTSHRYIRPGTTAVLLTPRSLEENPADESRGHWLILPADSERTRSFFRFEPDVNFEQCMPAEQLMKGK